MKQFGQIEAREPKRLKELDRENTKLKKMRAESLLKKPGTEVRMRKKVVGPRHRRTKVKMTVVAKMSAGRAACQFLTLFRSTLGY